MATKIHRTELRFESRQQKEDLKILAKLLNVDSLNKIVNMSINEFMALQRKEIDDYKEKRQAAKEAKKAQLV